MEQIILSLNFCFELGRSSQLRIYSPPLLLLLPLPSLLSLPLCRHPCLPLQPCCNDCHCHGRCLRCYQCRLPHFFDSCLPPQFLLLSATPLATVTATATADPVLAAAAVTVRHRHCHHRCQRFKCRHRQCPHCCLCFHPRQPLLLPLAPPPFPHVPHSPRLPFLSQSLLLFS